jgi:hypothetical protein
MRVCAGWCLVAFTVLAAGGGCARLPFTTATIYESSYTQILLQQEVEPAGYTHPIRFTADQVAALLHGFSLRAEQSVPLRWFAEEQPPQKLLREDEIARLATYLVDAFEKAGPNERVHFALSAPGINRADAKTVTSGWMAVREPFLYVTVEQFHAEVPIRRSDQYLPNNPQMPPLPGSFLLFFEPGRFWRIDRAGVRALEYREFLKSAPAGPAAP